MKRLAMMGKNTEERAENVSTKEAQTGQEGRCRI